MTDHGSNGLEASFPSPTSRRRLGVTSVDKLVTGAENAPSVAAVQRRKPQVQLRPCPLAFS